jgi:hypothetical protein
MVGCIYVQLNGYSYGCVNSLRPECVIGCMNKRIGDCDACRWTEGRLTDYFEGR